MNVKMSPDDCRDAIKKNIDDFLLKDMTSDEFFLSLVDNLTFDSIDQVLNATANLFQSKIVRFYKEDSNYLHKTFISNVQPTEVPLYIFSEGCGKKRFNFNIQEHRPVTNYTQKDLFQCSATIRISATSLKKLNFKIHVATLIRIVME